MLHTAITSLRFSSHSVHFSRQKMHMNRLLLQTSGISVCFYGYMYTHISASCKQRLNWMWHDSALWFMFTIGTFSHLSSYNRSSMTCIPYQCKCSTLLYGRMPFPGANCKSHVSLTNWIYEWGFTNRSVNKSHQYVSICDSVKSCSGRISMCKREIWTLDSLLDKLLLTLTVHD